MGFGRRSAKPKSKELTDAQKAEKARLAKEKDYLDYMDKEQARYVSENLTGYRSLTSSSGTGGFRNKKMGKGGGYGLG